VIKRREERQTTINELAGMVKAGFNSVDKRFDGME